MEIALIVVIVGALVAVGWLMLALRRARVGTLLASARADQSEAAGRIDRQRSRSMLEALPSVALRVDDGGRVLETSRRAQERFPFLRPGISVLEAFSEHLLAGRVDTALETLEAQHFEVRLFDDGRRTYQAVVEPYELPGGPEALLVLMDTTEAVAYQELRSQFVANVSHELRTPLTGLRGLLETLDDPAMDDDTRSDFVGRGINETQRLEALITDILFLSELEATADLPLEASSDMVTAVEEASLDLTEAAGASGVQIALRTDEVAWCPLSEAMARTVARNLIENAVKYAGPGAVVDVTVQAAAGEVVLSVADDGAGIPERHVAHIFERFYRADPSRSKRLGGTGLGLSIVKHIVERFGGRVAATSREGFGTTITVAMPMVPPPAASTGSSGPGPSQATPDGL